MDYNGKLLLALQLHYAPSAFTIERENSRVLMRISTAVLLQITHPHCKQPCCGANLVPRVFVPYCASLMKRVTLKSSVTRSILIGFNFKNKTNGRK